VTEALPKLLLTPVLIALATAAGRRWGPLVGGWCTGFPLSSGPVSVFLALEQGPEFAARAATGTLLGLVSATAFSMTYRLLAPRTGWARCAGPGVAAFLATTAVLAQVPVTTPSAFGLVCAVLAGCLPLMRRGPRPALALPPPPAWDVPARMVTATALVSRGLLWTYAAAVLASIAVNGVSLALSRRVSARRDGGPDELPSIY